MCGIFGYLGNKTNAADIVFDGLKNLEYRGYDSFGIFAKDEAGHPFLLKKTGPLPINRPILPASHFALGHTRWATHGGVTVANAHPHFDCQKKIFVVHNGIVENFEELKKELIKKGHRFVSQTDTEVISHLIEEYQKTQPFVGAARLAFLQLRGFNAVAAASLTEETFVCLKNISPIALGQKNGQFYFASDPNSVALFTDKIHFMEDETMTVITRTGARLFSIKSYQKQPLQWQHYEPITFADDHKQYPHFMLKEIFEEPMVITRLLKNQNQLKSLARAMQTSYGSYLIGAGSAGFAGLFGTYIFSKLAKHHVNASFASEFGYYQDFLTQKSLVIALSQSGETADVIAAIKAAQQKHTRLAAITNVFGSSLYRAAEIKVLLEAGPERAVLATKSFLAKLTVLLLLVSYLSQNHDIINQLQQAAKELTLLKRSALQKQLQVIGKQLSRKEHLFVIGRGANYPLALEGALKIKEGSYVHAEGLAGGELKHGVIALIEKGTSCLVLCPSDETYDDILANAMELKSRGAWLIGLGSKKNQVFDEFIDLKDAGPGTYLLMAFVLQLLGYYTAVARGLNPDRPRNLAKSVTVK